MIFPSCKSSFMAEIFSKTILNRLPELEALRREAAVFLEGKASSEAIHAVQLTLEEMITNTIKYGYDDKARHSIEVRIEPGDASIYVTILDDGHEFDPLLAPPADVSKSVEERSIGGLGIHLVRSLAASMKYVRLDGKNILQLDITNPTASK
jgi:serine/threonine-protein kinase RsbW